MRTPPFALAYDEEIKRFRAISLDDGPLPFLGLNEHQVRLNATSDYGGILVHLYDTYAEAFAAIEALQIIVPHHEYNGYALRVEVGGDTCGVAVFDICWLGDQVLFRDKRKTD